jgi:hypothetical protein
MQRLQERTTTSAQVQHTIEATILHVEHTVSQSARHFRFQIVKVSRVAALRCSTALCTLGRTVKHLDATGRHS